MQRPRRAISKPESGLSGNRGSGHLEQVRAAYRYNKIVFPQMTRGLPDDERDQLCFAFFKELERIELLMAA
jgi:hypothetical protein